MLHQVKDLKNISIWIGLAVYLAFALSFTGEKRKSAICREVQVRILDSMRDRFVTAKQIQDYIYELDLKVLGEPVNSINTRKLEQYLNGRDNIKKVEVYSTSDGKLHVEINQRNPILRVINDKGQSYYIDEEGAIIPLSTSYSSHVPVATGSITEFFEVPRRDYLNCSKSNRKGKNNAICEIYKLARFINSDPFWEAQIEQIYRNDKGEYELIPRVGAHLIIFGDFGDYRKKFRNLKAFYKQGLNNVGWNQYLKINLKYDNQIICTKNNQNES